jgi:uncharacterized alkaline shock family protein YloU
VRTSTHASAMSNPGQRFLAAFAMLGVRAGKQDGPCPYLAPTARKERRTPQMAEKGEEAARERTEEAKTAWSTTPGRTPEATPIGEVEAAETSRGRTTIAATVVQKISVTATRQVSGVHAMGGGTTRPFGVLRERIPGASSAQTSGVIVEVGAKQAAIDLEITAEYGIRLVELATAVRRNVITAVEGMTGLEVVEVNITLTDIRLPGEEEPPARVE